MATNVRVINDIKYFITKKSEMRRVTLNKKFPKSKKESNRGPYYSGIISRDIKAKVLIGELNSVGIKHFGMKNHVYSIRYDVFENKFAKLKKVVIESAKGYADGHAGMSPIAYETDMGYDVDEAVVRLSQGSFGSTNPSDWSEFDRHTSDLDIEFYDSLSDENRQKIWHLFDNTFYNEVFAQISPLYAIMESVDLKLKKKYMSDDSVTQRMYDNFDEALSEVKNYMYINEALDLLSEGKKVFKKEYKRRIITQMDEWNQRDEENALSRKRYNDEY